MANQGRVRIVGGHWRGRQLHLGKASALRPTPDRVRETVFNWLQRQIQGARCLDLFAGSGVLGFEAASRGARSVVLVEHDRALIRALRDNHERLGATETVSIVASDARRFLQSVRTPFDLVFLDPPYADAPLLCDTSRTVMNRLPLTPGALIYLESPRHAPPPALADGWQWFRQGQAGQVRFGLANALDSGSMSLEA